MQWNFCILNSKEVGWISRQNHCNFTIPNETSVKVIRTGSYLNPSLLSGSGLHSMKSREISPNWKTGFGIIAFRCSYSVFSRADFLMCYSQWVCEDGYVIIRNVSQTQCSLCELEQLQPQKNHMRPREVTQDACWSRAWESVSLKVQRCILHPP